MSDEHARNERLAARHVELNVHLVRWREDAALIGAAHRAQNMAVSQVYVCELCPRDARHVTTSRSAMIVHWTDVHQLLSDQWESALSRFEGHSDAREWSQDDTRYILRDGRNLLLRSVRIRRTGDNAAAWGGE